MCGAGGVPGRGGWLHAPGTDGDERTVAGARSPVVAVGEDARQGRPCGLCLGVWILS